MDGQRSWFGKTAVLFVVAPLALGAPGAAQVSTTSSGPAEAAWGPLQDEITFSNVSAEAGLGGLYTEGNSHCGGCAWVDYNGDFWPDLFVTNGTGHPHWLFRNEGDGTFADVSDLVAKPDPQIPDAGVKFGDLDNDGDQEILVVVDHAWTSTMDYNPPDGGPNLLYVNQGDGTFVEDAAGTGILDPLGRRNICAGLADYDRDGFLDVYIANWQMNGGQEDNDDRILHNDGDGTFTDVTAQLGLDAYGRDTLTCLWYDAELDGWPDLYVGVATALPGPTQNPNDVFYSNQGGTFVDATGDPTVLGNDAQAAMGADIGDIDNDGDWDLYVTDQYLFPVPPLGNPLYLGDGNGGFLDNTADVAGVQANNSWPTNFVDFDHDGWVDLFVGRKGAQFPDFVYMNERDGTFRREYCPELFGNGLRGGSVADYDGDGDMDLFFWNYRQESELIRNDSKLAAPVSRWLELKLIGTTSNRDAIGALVRVTTGGLTQMRRVSGGDSAHSQQDTIVHFGVGDATRATVRIDWPSGAVQTFSSVATNQLVFVDESAGVMTEDVTPLVATWSSAAQALELEFASNFGGRSRLTADGFGPLAYQAASVSYHGTWSAAQAPTTVTVTSERGGSWNVPVTVVP